MAKRVYFDELWDTGAEPRPMEKEVTRKQAYKIAKHFGSKDFAPRPGQSFTIQKTPFVERTIANVDAHLIYKIVVAPNAPWANK